MNCFIFSLAYHLLQVSYCLALASGDIEGAKKYCKEAKEKAELDGQNQENNLLPKV